MCRRPIDPGNDHSGPFSGCDRNIHVCVRTRRKAMHRSPDEGSGERPSDGKDVDDPPIGFNRAIYPATVDLTAGRYVMVRRPENISVDLPRGSCGIIDARHIDGPFVTSEAVGIVHQRFRFFRR